MTDDVHTNMARLGHEELDVEEKDYQVNKEAADSCPVNVIHITNKETGEKII